MSSTIKKYAAVCVIALGFAGAAMAGPAQDVVNGPGKQPVTSAKFGTCVETKWNNPDNPCAPVKPPVKQIVETPPPPPAPEPVLQLVREELTIYFLFNKADLTPGGKSKLDRIADAVNRSPKVTKVNIVGYTDQIGSESYNAKLSQKRADNVKAYLDTKTRIDTSVLGLRGLGEADPVTGMTCDKIKKRQEKIDCLARDRRVEVEFEFQK